MYVDETDARPPSLLRRKAINVLALVIGVVVAVTAHVLFASLILIVGVLFGSEVLAHEEAIPEDEPPEVEFIEAEFVKLGRQFDPRELPNRQREARSTAPRRSDVPTRDSRRVRIPEDAGIRPADAVDDELARLGTRADEMARIARAAEQEGDPEGIEEGTATREEGDIYRGLLYAFFRRGLQRPSTIPDGELRGLRAVVQVESSPDGRITGFRMARPSGNADFDQAVRLRMDQAVGSRLPEPPEEERDQYWGTRFQIGIVPPR